MGNTKSCDGPGCKEVLPDIQEDTRVLSDPLWFTVSHPALRDYHFHSIGCLTLWGEGRLPF